MRADNYTPDVITKSLKAVLKSDVLTAFSECKQFDDHIKSKQKEVTDAFTECANKYPSDGDWLKGVFNIDNLKDANNQLSMLKDAINCLEMKMELMKDNVKENGNLLSLLKAAL